MTRAGAAVAAAVLGALLLGGPAAAAPQDVASSISGEIMSPFCPGVTLHECPSAEADALRDRIGRWAAAGVGRDEIMSRLTAEYGPGIRAVPRPEGVGLLAWVLPAVALGSGAILVWFLARRWARHSDTARDEAPPTKSYPPEQRERIEVELAAMREGLADPGAAP